MDFNKKVRAAKGLALSKFFGVHKPLAVSWSITNRCDNKCLYCDVWKSKKKEMGTGEALSVVDDMAKNGTLVVSLVGGEPLVRNDIGLIIDSLTKKGIVVRITTNGNLLPKRIKVLKNVDLIKISFDGPRKIHDSLRGRGTYDNVLRAIHVAKQNNLDVQLNTTLSKYNINFIDEIIAFSNKNGVKVKFEPVHSFGDKVNVDKLKINPKEYNLALRKLIVYKKKTNSVVNSFSSLRYYLNYPYNRIIKCCGGRILCRISSEGYVFPCTMIEGKVKSLSCLDHGLGDAFGAVSRGGCKACLCSTTLELNLIYSLKLDSYFAHIFD